MNVRIDPALFDADEFVVRQELKSLLRFIVCGSVDHGKSTLIGRLLYESGLVLADQLEALDHESPRYGTQGDERDFALLLDGLAAEREQKITIDVAYRFFTTARRKFIVIDAPGHEQYTANMATGASVADLALVVVAADEGLTRQLKRHLVVLSLLGIRNAVLAVNKMDRVGWSCDAFGAVETTFRELAADLGFVNVAWDGGVHAFILDTVVSAALRHSGIGAQLVAEAASGARAANCEWLHVDFEDDLRAFYFDACGFRPTNAGLIAL